MSLPTLYKTTSPSILTCLHASSVQCDITVQGAGGRDQVAAF